MSLTIRSCIPGFSLCALVGAEGGKESIQLLVCRESAPIGFCREKKIYFGYIYRWLRSCQKAQGQQQSHETGLALSPPAPRGAPGQAHTEPSQHLPRPVPSCRLCHKIWVCAHRKGWISFFNKNPFSGIFPEEINDFVAENNIGHIFTK